MWNVRRKLKTKLDRRLLEHSRTISPFIALSTCDISGNYFFSEMLYFVPTLMLIDRVGNFPVFVSREVVLGLFAEV